MAVSLNNFCNRWCKRENVEPEALKEWKINIFKIIDTPISFYSRNTLLLPSKPISFFVILNEVSRIFIWTMFWFQQIKLLTMLLLFDDCIISILLSMSLLTPMPINCSLLWVRGWLSMVMVVIQPYILMSKIRKTKDKVPTLYWIPKLHKTL